MSHPISCPHGHGPLQQFTPATWDGTAVMIGGCLTCGGLWVPVQTIHSVLPEELSLAMARVSLSEAAPRCGACEDHPRMSQQHFGGVEVDRCLYCHGLWLDGGELGSLQTATEEALARPACDACGVCVAAGELSATGMGRLCRRCLASSNLRREAAPLPSSPETARIGAEGTRWERDARGGETLFEFRGALDGSPVRGSITHENRFSRMMKAVGSTDAEVGDPVFDARFLVKTSDEGPMLRWLGSGRVASDLLLLDGEGGCTVRVDADGLEILGSQGADQPTPNPVVEEAAARVYGALLAVDW